ncbi:MAG: hypothetical protein ACXVXO_14020 [Mycobacteriaceae bacterium]
MTVIRARLLQIAPQISVPNHERHGVGYDQANAASTVDYRRACDGTAAT